MCYFFNLKVPANEPNIVEHVGSEMLDSFVDHDV